MAEEAWSAADVPDQSGRVAVVTGANSGIGFEAAKVLAARGASVVLACRNPVKAADAEASIVETQPGAATSVTEMDLSSLDSVRAGAAAIRADHERIDLLINNAGIMAVPERRSVDGFELQLATNHLGHFALTGLLMDRLLVAPASRVVAISSQAHRFGSMDFEDLNWERGYKSWGAYGRSKLANLLFVYELQRRLDRIGSETIATAAHPGFSRTELQRREPGSLMDRLERLTRPVMGLVSQDAETGALPTLRAATDPDAVGGDYYGPSGFGEQTGPPVRVASSRASRDEADAARLWSVSERLTGVTYPFDA
jgi:NAD(P)-dependent dehydrogenase (short-subunit alcohol dehydrogenase family)